jgi:hypothetical protein
MSVEATVACADRRDDQDILEWVQNTMGQALLADHRKRSPWCRSNVTEYAKFEVDPAGGRLGTLKRQ